MSRAPDSEVQYVEKVVHDARPLTGYLQALGFVPVAQFQGSTKSRAFERGAARILVSEVADSVKGHLDPAIEAGSLQGDSSVKVALRVPDVPRALMLATEGGAQVLSGTRAYSDHAGTEMAQLANVSGAGVRYQLFAAPGPTPGQTPGLQREMSIDCMVIAVQFYHRALGLELLWAKQIRAEGEQIRAAGPGGRGWAVAIITQEPAGAQGLVSAFLSANGGPGIAHLALRVPDVLAAVTEATARGLEFLPIPGAYYPPAQGSPGLADLRRRRVAAGRNEAGEVIYEATTGPVSPACQVSFGLVQRPEGDPVFCSETAVALTAARAAARALSRQALSGIRDGEHE